MRKMIPMLALMALLAGCTSACGGQEAVSPADTPTLPPATAEMEHTTALPSQSVPQAVLPSETPAVESAPPPAEETVQPTGEPAVTELPGDTPDDEAVLAAYRSAAEAFRWFQMSTMDFDPEDQQTVDGNTYYRVDHAGIDSTASLRGYLKGLFSDDLVEGLLPYDGTQYIDIDGVLYVLPGDRGSDVTKGGETVQVIRGEDPNRCTVRVTVEVLDPEAGYQVTGSEVHDFPYEKVGNRWIFTDFSLVR